MSDKSFKISIADDNVHNILSKLNKKNIVKSKSSNSNYTASNYSNDSEHKIINEDDFNTREACYYNMIRKFFKSCTDAQIEKMINILNKESTISLRIMDWFVTKYSNKYNICYKLNKSDDDFNVHISYKAQLKSYKKKYFDPFRRRKKFYFNYDKNNKNKKILTTIGQLNFFKWSFINGIIDYVEKHHKEISVAMNKSNKDEKKRKEKISLLKGKKHIKKIINLDNKIKFKSSLDEDDMKPMLTFD